MSPTVLQSGPYRFPQNELNKIEALVREHQAMLSKAWHDYFKSGNGNGGGQAGPRH